MVTKIKPRRVNSEQVPEWWDKLGYEDPSLFGWSKVAGDQADWEETDPNKQSYILNKPYIPVVNDNFTSESDKDTVSAKQLKKLKENVDTLSAHGLFLSLWDSEDWSPISFPYDIPYTYKTWDYFLIEKTAETNFKPTGSAYDWTKSSVVETDEVASWDMYIFDWTIWLLQINHWKTVSFVNLAWDPHDNEALWNELDSKVDKTTWAYRIYATWANAADALLSYTVDAWANTVPYRSTTWTISTATPTADAHAATKKYVDDKTIVDEELDSTSTHPVQNKVITDALYKIESLQAPNATIIWEPTIVAWNISDFSQNDYLIVPFLSSFVKNPFILHMDISTKYDIDTQQNIIDSDKWLAFAIRNKRFTIAISTDWTSWIWEYTWNYMIAPNTDYHVEIERTLETISLRYSLDWTNFITDISIPLNTALSWKPLYIWWFGSVSHPFKWTLNFNEWRFKSGWNIVRKWMDVAWLETRANISLSNLDEEWEKKLRESVDLSNYVQKWDNMSSLAWDATYNANLFYNIWGTVPVITWWWGWGWFMRAWSLTEMTDDITWLLVWKPSFSWTFSTNTVWWQTVLSVRHRNWLIDWQNYWMYLRSALTSEDDLHWQQQAGGWLWERTIVDNKNVWNYALPISWWSMSWNIVMPSWQEIQWPTDKTFIRLLANGNIRVEAPCDTNNTAYYTVGKAWVSFWNWTTTQIKVTDKVEIHNVKDPTADWDAASKSYVDSKYSTITVTLTSSWWSNNTQTVTATWVTASNTVIVSPAPTSITDYTWSKIYCSAQWTNSLTFTCNTTPSNNITVNAVILK